jgi:hypothetical protein
METKRASAGGWLMSASLALLLVVGCTPPARDTRTTPSDAAAPPPREEGRVPAEAPADRSEPSDLVHTVRWKGESLSIIAKWYTGKAGNWRRLAEHNPLNDPDRIGIGDRISVPAPLLRTREPLPRDFVKRHVRTPKEADPSEEPEPSRPVEAPAPEDEGPELFGPKDLKNE